MKIHCLHPVFQRGAAFAFPVLWHRFILAPAVKRRQPPRRRARIGRRPGRPRPRQRWSGPRGRLTTAAYFVRHQDGVRREFWPTKASPCQSDGCCAARSVCLCVCLCLRFCAGVFVCVCVRLRPRLRVLLRARMRPHVLLAKWQRPEGTGGGGRGWRQASDALRMARDRRNGCTRPAGLRKTAAWRNTAVRQTNKLHGGRRSAMSLFAWAGQHVPSACCAFAIHDIHIARA